MTVPCNASQIADFVLLWGMSGTFPQYCIYAEDARDLKSIDLITSTMGIFVEAFWLRFEGIYRKCRMDFPLSEEKFIEFLKPRCLLLTKDDKCFNFLLVCAFVSEIIHSFFEQNKCFHLVKVASKKCLAAILKNRFKRIFESDSGWEELMSFCIKIHNLIYPNVKKYKYAGNQSVREFDESAEREVCGKESDCRFLMTAKTGASFPNLAQGITESSIEKYAADDNYESDTKVSSKKTSTPLKKDLTIEMKGGKLKGLSKLEFPVSTAAAHVLQLKDEDSPSKEESVHKEKSCYEKNTEEANENAGPTGMNDLSSPTLLQELANITVSKNDEDTEKLDQMIGLKKQLSLSFRKDLAIKKVPEKLDLSDSERTSTDESVALQMKDVISFRNEESEDKEKVADKSNPRNGNEKDYATDSLLPDLDHQLAKLFTEKQGINKNTEGAEKPGQMIGFRKKLTLPSGNASIEVNKLEDLCKLESDSSTDAPHALQFKEKESSSEEDLDDNEEQFSIFCMTADQICLRIADNPQHLSEIMDLIKKCEDIEPNLFSVDESDILISDKYNEDLKASDADSEISSDSDLTIFELGIKTVVFATNFQNMKMDLSMERTFCKDNSSGDESISKSSGDDDMSSSSIDMSNGITYEYSDLHCPLCAGRMQKFFDACVNHFHTNWSRTHDLVTDLFSYEFHENYE